MSHDCPRCKLTLQEDDYEGVDVLFCSTCWGHWVERDALASILANDDYRFSSSEAKAVSKSIFKPWVDIERDDPDRLESASCPVCGKEMQTSTFTDGCPVEVDICHDHGVWLDTAEVKQIQIFFESDK